LKGLLTEQACREYVNYTDKRLSNKKAWAQLVLEKTKEQKSKYVRTISSKLPKPKLLVLLTNPATTIRTPARGLTHQFAGQVSSSLSEAKKTM